MIPIRLALRNFLSYGEAAEPLDFEQFHVACLSGRNGQGKSALLEAMTWAVWGEGRKSSDKRKPDEELLRIGAREMEVEFEFVLESTRYRVRRGYQRSASGKTSKPELHFHVQDGEAWRALGQPSVAATQEAIIEALGLDFDTFANSAFLMQGRSDEFTRRKPAERKQVLARLLGLDRYRRLERAAGDRLRALRSEIDLASAERDRLRESQAELPRLREERAEVAAALDAASARLDAARGEVERLAASVQAVEVLERRTAEQRDRLDALRVRRDALATRRAELDRRIEIASELLDRAEAIGEAYERFRALQDERSELDDRLGQRNGLEQRRTQLHAEVAQLRADLRQRLATAEGDHRAAEERRKDLRRRLERLPELRRELAEADAAAKTADALDATRRARIELEKRIAAHEADLKAARATLSTELAGCREQQADDDRMIAETAAARTRVATLDGQLAELPEVAQRLEEVKARGTELRHTVATLEADEQRLTEEREAVVARIDLLAALETDACPTCGTELTDAHRAEVRATYEAERDALARRIAEAVREQQRRRAELEALRNDYKAAFQHHEKLVELQAERDRLRGQLDAVADLEARRERNAARAAALTEQLRADAFAPDIRDRLAADRSKLDATPLDERALEAAQQQAAAVPSLRRRLIEMEQDAGSLESLDLQVEQQAARLVRMRAETEGDTALGDRPERLREVDAQIAALGYDPARHEAVRRELVPLADAPKDAERLLHARENAATWREERVGLAEEDQQLSAEAADIEVHLAETRDRLAELPSLRRSHETAVGQRSEAETELHAVQERRGRLAEQIERAERDRTALATVRAELKQLKEQQSVYRHLKRAFSKDGIPALLIEQAIPEVEARANAMLGRLTGGRTRVQLETQAEKRDGGTKETLDIKLSDEHGVARSYETFSGGEAFRVNFALRVALAQLLAERSGVRIRTLVIDEGFGTQDREGIEAMVEAIQSVREDFAKILVITHLDALKDAFPVRIEVEKDPAVGSRFEVLGV